MTMQKGFVSTSKSVDSFAGVDLPGGQTHMGWVVTHVILTYTVGLTFSTFMGNTSKAHTGAVLRQQVSSCLFRPTSWWQSVGSTFASHPSSVVTSLSIRLSFRAVVFMTFTGTMWVGTYIESMLFRASFSRCLSDNPLSGVSLRRGTAGTGDVVAGGFFVLFVYVPPCWGPVIAPVRWALYAK